MAKKTFWHKFQHVFHDDDEKTLNAASREAKKIIKNAVLRAEKMLAQVDVFDEFLKDEIRKQLSFVIEKNTVKIMKEFQELVTGQLAASQSLMLKSLEEEAAKTKEELEIYKTKKIAQIDSLLKAQVKEEANRLAIKVFKHSIPESNLEETVIEVLKEAKDHGFFN